jgi:hypothetical protein
MGQNSWDANKKLRRKAIAGKVAEIAGINAKYLSGD